jgi:hypothetical protein
MLKHSFQIYVPNGFWIETCICHQVEQYIDFNRISIHDCLMLHFEFKFQLDRYLFNPIQILIRNIINGSTLITSNQNVTLDSHGYLFYSFKGFTSILMTNQII